VGYNFTDAVRADVFASYSFGTNETRDLETLAIAANIVTAAAGVATTGIASNSNMGSEIMIGAGINIELP
jgi:hypothetical protein